jgi:UTP--glucose-1-phosphate uridylyltransferase
MGDDVLTKGKGAMAQLVEFYEKGLCDAVAAVQKLPKEEFSHYAIIKPVDVNEQEGYGRVESLIEKPEIDKAPSDLASYGRMVMSYDIFNYLSPEQTGKDNELWLQDAVDRFSREHKYFYKILEGEWITTGDPARYFKAVVKYYLAHEKYGPEAKEFLKKLNL